MICNHGDCTQFYIKDLQLCDDSTHVGVFSEVAITFPPEHLSTKLCGNQSCMKLLTSVQCAGCTKELVKTLGSMITRWKHLKRIVLYCFHDYAGDVFELVQRPGQCSFEIRRFIDEAGCALTSAGAVKLAGLLARFNNVTCLVLDLTDCCAEALTSLALSIIHKTIKRLKLTRIPLTPEAAAILGQALGEMTSLYGLVLEGRGSCLNAEEMTALFGGFKRSIPLTRLKFYLFRARGTLGPLINSLRFFPDLNVLFLAELDMDKHDLRGLLESCRFIPKLFSLTLSGNPLGHAVTSIVLHESNLPKLRFLKLRDADCSEEDKSYLREALTRPPFFVRVTL